MGALLKLGGLHGDGDADEEDTEHGDGCVAAPVDGAAVGPSRHAPHLLAEVAAPVPAAMVAAHRRRRRCSCSDSIRSGVRGAGANLTVPSSDSCGRVDASMGNCAVDGVL